MSWLGALLQVGRCQVRLKSFKASLGWGAVAVMSIETSPGAAIDISSPCSHVCSCSTRLSSRENGGSGEVLIRSSFLPPKTPSRLTNFSSIPAADHPRGDSASPSFERFQVRNQLPKLRVGQLLPGGHPLAHSAVPQCPKQNSSRP